MQDKFGRKIEYMRISLTDRCNLRCVYCMPEDGIEKKGHEEILSFEEFEKITEVAVELGIKKIRLTGGEPLIRKGLVGFIKHLNSIPGLEEITLTTNGTLLPEMARELKEAGLDRVNISLDTLRPERFKEITRLGRLEDVMEGIQATKKAGLLPIKINTVLIRGFNDDEIEDFIKLSVEEGIIIRFIELMPIGGCAAWSSEHYISAEEILERHPELIPIDEKTADKKRDEESYRNSGPARYYSLVDGTGRIGFIDPVSHSFCSACNRIRLTADGKIKPCLHSDEEIDIKTALRKGADEGSTKAEIRRALEETVFHKPENHQFKQDGEGAIKRDMYKIGG